MKACYESRTRRDRRVKWGDVLQTPREGVYKELFQQQNDTPFFKKAKNLNRHFPKEDMQMANKHLKSCSTSLAIRETQIKTTTRCRFIPTMTATMKKTEENSC